MNNATESATQIELEAKLAYQEKAIADLNDALVDQTRTVIELVRRVEVLEKVVRNLNQQVEASAERPPNEKPPHY